MSNIGPKFILDDRFTFDPTSNSLVDKEADDEIVRLGSNESRILLMLSQRPNEVVTRNELHDFVWREQGFEVDDSSLTQAISTLRKNLKDSTKSPQFVKTVPKRGYQLICNVYSINEPLDFEPPTQVSQPEKGSLASELTAEEPELNAGNETNDKVIEHTEFVKHSESVSVQNDDEVTAKNQKSSKSTDFVTKMLLLLAILMPIFVLTWMSPTPSKFIHLASYNGIEVNAPRNQPELTSWLPSIKQCIEAYSVRHTGEYKATQVIATGGQDNVLVLNYVSQPLHSVGNFTVRIFGNQSDLSNLCR